MASEAAAAAAARQTQMARPLDTAAQATRVISRRTVTASPRPWRPRQEALAARPMLLGRASHGGGRHSLGRWRRRRRRGRARRWRRPAREPASGGRAALRPGPGIARRPSRAWYRRNYYRALLLLRRGRTRGLRARGLDPAPTDFALAGPAPRYCSIGLFP